MVRRRIGNDIEIEWGVYRGDTPEDFSGKTIELFIIERGGKMQQVDNSLISISGNTISFIWGAGNQYSIGNYSLVLKEYVNGSLCNTVDIADAIELVANTALEEGDADYIADSSVTFRSDFNVVFSSIEKAYMAASSAAEQATVADNSRDTLETSITAANEAYEKLKDLLGKDSASGGGGDAFCYLEKDENGNVVVKDRLKLIVNNRLEAQAIAGLALEVPSGAPNTEYTKDGEWYIYVGELGEGSDTPPSGGGGTSVVWGDGVKDSYWGLDVAGDAKIVSLHGHKHQFTDITGTDHLATQDDINTLQGNIDTVSTRVGAIEGDYLSKSKGGEVTADVTISAALKMNTLYLPSSSSLPSEWYLYIGELGSGSDTPESGGGADISSIIVYDTNGKQLGNGNDEGNIIIAAYPDLTPYATNDALTTGLAGKQNVISDLETIRSGAALGATAIQPEIFNEELSKKYDKTGGEIRGDVDITGSLRMGTLILPNKSGTEGDYELYVGSLGSGSDTPGGGGLDEDAMWNALASVDNSKVIDASHIPNLSWNKITSDKPTILSGYGITDFVVETISSLNNAAAKAGIYRLGGTAPDNHGYGNALTLRHLAADTYSQLYIPYNMNLSKKGVYWRGATTDNTTQSWRLMLDESNYSSYALPLSGGILSDSWSGGTEIRRKDNNNGYASLIFSQANGTVLGRFGFGGVDNPLFITQAGGYNTLIHSGNIGSQSVNYANSAGTVSGSIVNESINFSKNDNAIRLFYDAGAGISPTGWGGGVSIISEYCGFQFFTHNRWSTAPQIYARIINEDGWSSWKALAFTDSNVASATKLITSGGSEYANVNSDGLLLIGGGSANWTTVIDGTNIHLRTNNWAYGIFIADNGNVIIGSGADSGAKLQVNGNIDNYTNGEYSGVIGLNRKSATGGLYNTSYHGWQIHNYKGDLQFYLEKTDGSYMTPLHIVGSNGNVLIGTTTDLGNKLQVYDAIGIQPNSNGYSGMFFFMNTNTKENWHISARGGETNKPFRLYYSPDYSTYNALIDVTKTGNVLIGTTTDDTVAKLQVNGNTNITGHIQGYSFSSNYSDTFTSDEKAIPWYGLSVQDAYHKGVWLTGYSYIRIHTAYNTTTFNHNGIFTTANIYSTGGITAKTSSDRRLKENITTISDDLALSTLMALNPITFTWNSKATELCSWLNGEGQGFIAQEYERLIPNSGSEMWGEYRGIDYNRAIPYIVKVEQNHETRIQQIVSVEQNHETRIKQLEEELQTLKREYYGKI